MTEPGTGSDQQAVRATAREDGNRCVLSSQKTFISDGQSADLIVVVTKTDPALGATGISLIVVETDKAEGFRRRRNLEKLGFEMQDTSELFFDDVRVPTANLHRGGRGTGFRQLCRECRRNGLPSPSAASRRWSARSTRRLLCEETPEAFGLAP